MSSNSIIKCGLCNYQFKVYKTTEKHYHDYELEDEVCYYPQAEENAHIVGDYICDECYKNIGDKVKSNLLQKGEEFINELQIRKDNEHKKYLDNIQELEKQNMTVKDIYDKLKSTNNIFDLSNDTIEDLTSKKYPYALGGTYYLKSAIDIEKRNKLNVKKVYEWADKYFIKILKVPDRISIYDFVTIEQFKEIIFDCEIKGMTPKQVMELASKL